MVLEWEKEGHRIFPGIKLGFRFWEVHLTLFSNWCGLCLCLCSVQGLRRSIGNGDYFKVHGVEWWNGS